VLYFGLFNNKLDFIKANSSLLHQNYPFLLQALTNFLPLDDELSSLFNVSSHLLARFENFFFVADKEAK